MKKIYLKLMALALLSVLSVTNAWAGWKVYYGNTTSQVYIHLWNAGSDNTNWGSRRAMQLVPGTTDVWYTEVTQTSQFNCIFCSASSGNNNKLNSNDLTVNANNLKFTSTGTTGTSYTPPTVYSVTVSTESSLKGTISAPASSPTSVVEDGSLTITASEKSGYYFTSWTASPAGNATFANANQKSTTATITGNVTITAHFTNSLQEALIAGSYIMVYGGERVDWSQSTYYFMTENNTSKAVASPTMSGTYYIHDNSTKYEFGAATLSPGTYYQGHWASNLSCAVTAGHAYVVRGSSSESTYFTQKANSGSDYLYEVKKAGSTSPTYRVSTTIDSEVPQGGNISVSSGDPGVSSIGLPNSLVYYLYNGSTWSTLTVSEGVANVSALSVGEGYKIVTFLYDGHIYVKADEDEFEVIEATGHTITYTPQSTGWTYGTKPTAAEEGDVVTFVVTPTDGYSVTVSSSDVTLSGPNASNEYTFTMPDNDVSINVSATENTYTVTLVNATAGSVTAGCATRPTITAAAAPFGMTFDHWDVSGGASVANDHVSSTTVSATAAGIVTAVYVQNMWVYIQGRFEAYTDKTKQTLVRTGTNSGSKYWDTNSSALKMDYDSENHVYYLHTYKSPSELKQYDNDAKFYISLKTSSSSSGLSDVTEYFSDLETTIDAVGKDNKIGFATTPGSTRPYINNTTTTDKYLVLYWDGEYMWYEEEAIQASINNVALSDNVVPPGASITATPSMYVKGAVNKAYCWGVYTDAACTEGNKVDVSFNSIGGGKVDFAAPLTERIYYLKLKVHASADCEAAVDDEEIVSFTVTNTNMIYFKNVPVPQWSSVYVYLYEGDGANGYWDDKRGTGARIDNWKQVCTAKTMKRIGKTDIYYYQYSDWSGHVVAFADHEENTNQYFDQCQVAYREDFSTCAPMYVPENYIHDYLNYHDNDRYRTCYYSSNNANKIRGYWTTYPRTNAGFAIKLYGSADGSQEGDDITFTKTGANTYVADVNLDPATHTTYYYNLYTCAGDNGVSNTKYTLYGNSGNMSISDSENWNFYTQIARCRITPAAAGTYKFKLLLSDDGAVQVSVEYPLAVGDYRLLYTDGTHTKPHPTRFIRGRANGKDTISVWINPDDAYHVLKVQQCTAVSPKIIWSNYNWSGSDATGAINITSYSKGVYNFYLTQNESKALTVQTSKTAPYTGLYYIRCSSVGGGWLGYKTNDDNLMTYTKYAEDKNYGFNYYKAKWVNDVGSDVTYTIACDYSESLCDTLKADPGDYPLSAAQAASIPHNANIRFGWNSQDNTLQRAYINGSTNASDRYLVLKGEHEKIVDENGNAFSVAGLEADETTFVDLNNWIYRVDLKAKPNGGVKVIANYNGNEQFFIGDAGNYEKIIGSSEDQWWPLRVTYDFKTNRLMTAWLPSGTQVTGNIALNADMMLIREGQNAATQVYFSGNGKSISNIHTIYGVMEFRYSNIVDRFSSWSSPNAYKYLMYYISFPFDVKVSEIFGCGVRGKNWIIQKYNGAKRADKGWFAETSTFWETLPGDSTMHANEGYLLILDRISFNDASSSLWYKQSDGSSIYLYFPSTSATSGTISDDEVTITVPSHPCTINRSFTIDGVGTLHHSNTDSHWNVIGTPLFENKRASNVVAGPTIDGEKKFQYFYRWDYSDNSIDVEGLCDTTTFMAMHSYMVQYTGNITFTGAKLTPPSSVAARHMPSDKKNYRVELRMVNEDNKVSRTYVELRENACDTFALNEDMYMMRSSSKADLYTFAGAYDVAANVLSMNNHIVPVGMDVKRAGTYRFTMPSEFSGTVTLIDTETGIRTNLALGDYEVSLPKGTSNTRFLLEIDIQQMPTAIDGVGGSLKDGKAHKFIQNGQMYILQNGVIYDAQGRKMK